MNLPELQRCLVTILSQNSIILQQNQKIMEVLSLVDLPETAPGVAEDSDPANTTEEILHRRTDWGLS
jgi:hypothetical protein